MPDTRKNCEIPILKCTSLDRLSDSGFPSKKETLLHFFHWHKTEKLNVDDAKIKTAQAIEEIFRKGECHGQADHVKK
jgi:hypothetical protein